MTSRLAQLVLIATAGVLASCGGDEEPVGKTAPVPQAPAKTVAPDPSPDRQNDPGGRGGREPD